MTHDYGHVEQFDMEVPAAPELRGVGNYQEPKTFKVRASGNVHMGKTEKEKLSGITNKMENCSGITNCRGFKSEEVREKVDGTYNITYPIVTASIDLLAKRNWFMWGGSVSFNKGMSADLIIGANTKYFEAGLSIGAWMYTRKFNYSGTQYSCDQFLVWEDFSRYFFEDSSTTGVTLSERGTYNRQLRHAAGHDGILYRRLPHHRQMGSTHGHCEHPRRISRLALVCHGRHKLLPQVVAIF